MSWERFLKVLSGSIDEAQNTGFRILSRGIITHTQEKLGLRAYYDNFKIVVLIGYIWNL